MNMHCLAVLAVVSGVVYIVLWLSAACEIYCVFTNSVLFFFVHCISTHTFVINCNV